MKKNKRMIRFITIFVLIAIMTGCNNTEEMQVSINEMNDENMDLKERLGKLEEEVKEVEEQKRETTNELEASKTEVKDLKSNLQRYEGFDEETMHMINYLRGYNGRILTSDFQPIEKMAILNTSEGLRIFPEKGAPLFNNDKITYETHLNEGNIVMVHGYFNSGLDDGWAFITMDYFSSGYVRISELEPYIYDQSYEPAEQFRDFKIGMPGYEVYDYFNNNVELINDRNSFGHVIRVNNKDDENRRDIDFWYHPADERISVINTNSDKYPLESGFKVGDKAEEVLAYYDKLYEKSEYFNSETFIRYDIGDGYSLDFEVYDGIIVFIMINGGMYAYA